jgi:hypothetical protein
VVDGLDREHRAGPAIGLFDAGPRDGFGGGAGQAGDAGWGEPDGRVGPVQLIQELGL